MRTIVLMFAGVSLASCITASPQNKPVLTAVEHDSAAARAEQLAQQEQKRRDPGPYVTARCGPPPFAPTSTIVASPTSSLPPSPPSVAGPLNEPCSSSSINFERDHEQEARRLERQATTHRVAAAKLRGAEAVACSGLSEDERTADLLVPRDQVLAVRAVPDHSRTGKASSQSGGATLLLREQPGRSPDQIKHMLECQVARSRVQGRTELERSPLAVPGAQTNVVETDYGILVEVTASNHKSALEIARRAWQLQAINQR